MIPNICKIRMLMSAIELIIRIKAYALLSLLNRKLVTLSILVSPVVSKKPVRGILLTSGDKIMAGEKIDVSFEINADADKLIEQIVDKYDLPDKSKAIRCLLDYVEEKESEWDEMFATIRCNRCG